MPEQKKVLIIDDEIDLIEMIGFEFKARGFGVKTASDGIIGLQCLKTFKPDLIILDINMPRMGGVEFYSKICNADHRPLFPVMILTARANIQELFQNMVIDGLVIKPFEIDKLVEEANLIIEKRKQ